ncbi:MAG: signal recognition particle-docking protein FtsY [Simkaniaceae bacterium]|nr:signal recognition particle-docking protein FtsY [Simkaniaceae bacterium]MCF7852361.1 signal recognition particle-docking protein FtsY [Simkaniaceae bacterium]
MFKFFKSGISKLKNALKKTQAKLTSELKGLFSKPLSEDTLEELERILYEADLGSICVEEFVSHIRDFHKKSQHKGMDAYILEMKDYSKKILSSHLDVNEELKHPHLILVVGTNGSGKTTSCAKLAKFYKDQGKKVLLAAADTFRAAAIDQLSIWADRIGVDIVKGQPFGDPASVVYDAITKALAKDFDVIIADTAGRLESKKDLMRELEKIRRTAQKLIPDAPHETLLVIDATTGQTAIEQTKIFNSFTPLSSLVLSKLDGSAKGGIILAIYRQLNVPVHWVGTGETIDDFAPFEIDEYLDALFQL